MSKPTPELLHKMQALQQERGKLGADGQPVTQAELDMAAMLRGDRRYAHLSEAALIRQARLMLSIF